MLCSDIVFANSTCFDEILMLKIAEMAVNMRPGSTFISLTRALESSEFDIIDKQQYVSGVIILYYNHFLQTEIY